MEVTGSLCVTQERLNLSWTQFVDEILLNQATWDAHAIFFFI